MNLNSVSIYQKTYTREVSLVTVQIWEEQQCKLQREKHGLELPLSVYDACDGLVTVYYHRDLFTMWSTFVQDRLQHTPQFVPELIARYEEQLSTLETYWNNPKPLATSQELDEFYSVAAHGWVGMAICYALPETEGISNEYKTKGMHLRERSADYMSNTDRVVQTSLQYLFPQLQDLVRFITIEEVRSGSLPSQELLLERKRHYLYYNFQVHTNIALPAFIKSNNIQLEDAVAPIDASEVRGQVAMHGTATGAARILHRKSEIPLVQDGEILITPMTTPDFLPAMKKAAAIVTDEGGITSHAAITARELGKPCIIGTKFATQVFETGDKLMVDANSGTVKKLT
jgi:phosphohistidine swiveling domain-containing protein